MEKVTVMFSGGKDSVALALYLSDRLKFDVDAIHFDNRGSSNFPASLYQKAVDSCGLNIRMKDIAMNKFFEVLYDYEYYLLRHYPNSDMIFCYIQCMVCQTLMHLTMIAYMNSYNIQQNYAGYRASQSHIPNSPIYSQWLQTMIYSRYNKTLKTPFLDLSDAVIDPLIMDYCFSKRFHDKFLIGEPQCWIGCPPPSEKELYPTNIEEYLDTFYEYFEKVHGIESYVEYYENFVL